MYSQMTKKDEDVEAPSNSKNNNNDNPLPLLSSSLPSYSSSSILPSPVSTSTPPAAAMESKSDKEKDEEESNLKEYARLIGINPESEQHLMWIAEEGFTQPLSDEWKTVETEDGDFYFVNRKTGQSSWDHPMDENFRKMADHWRSNIAEPIPNPPIKSKPKRVMKIPASLNIVKASSSPTSPECPELLSSGSDKEKIYSSDSGTFDTDEDDDEIEKNKFFPENEDKKDYFYLSPRLDDSNEKEFNDGSKRVTFSKNLVKVYEFDATNMHWIRSNVFRKDGSDPQPIKEYLDNEIGTIDKITAGQRPSTPRMIPTERYEKLRQVQKRADAVINRNWREFCNAVTESYARAYQLASTVPSRPSTTF
uniref:WW domain-containing protein n=1 Tax=Panagrolaimus sp. PS1159 TaxID=55785 RepID=A0AC35F291_9BILA